MIKENDMFLACRQLIVLLFLLPAFVYSQESLRKKTSINSGWKFHLGDATAKNYALDADDSSWPIVNVPHSLELTSMDLNGYTDDKYQKTFMRNVGWYRKNIEVSSDKNTKVFLEFEGVHQVTDVWVNGKHVGQHSVGGYTPFHFDISSFVIFGSPNLVTVLADNRRREDVPPDPGPMDYIKFGGLYRDVYLVETNPVHITFNWESETSGQFVTTPTVDPVNMNGTINIKTAVRNETLQPQEVTAVIRLVDQRGIVVLKLSQSRNINSGQDVLFNQIGSLEENFHLWSVDDPYLYRVNTQLYNNGALVDQLTTKTGFRKVEINNDKGVLLNGKPIKLIGTNRHQHYGFIGDAMPNSLHFKDVLQLKQLGMNVLRTAHYPHDNAILEACDELGILVYEEAPTWMSIGNEAWFENFEKSLRTMVRNHRNHPSVIIWGAGINHRGYVPSAHNVIKQEDPFRFTASQSSRWTGWQTSGLTDIYGQMDYGPYYWSKEEPVIAMEGRRGPKAVNEYMEDPMKLGLIAWTAHAYYTFHPSDNPKDRSRSGLMTVFRYPRPGLSWYKAELTNYPFLHPETAWSEGIKEFVVYSNTEKVELQLNGKTFAEESPSNKEVYKHLKHPPFIFSIDNFQSGTLTANGLIDGEIAVSERIFTPDKPYKIVLDMDTNGREFTADGSDILVGYAKVTDKNGTIIRDAEKEIKFSVKGDASIVGDREGIGSNPMYTQYGVAPVLIRAGNSPGELTITAKSVNLKTASAIVVTKEANFDVIDSRAEPIYDFKTIKVDIGGEEQLVQFDWVPWTGQDKTKSTKEFKELDGFSATLAAKGDALLTRWLGEINVMGKYGFANGEGVLAASHEGLSLVLEGLKEGNYRLNTVHHAPRTNTDSMDPNQEKMTTYQIYQIPYASKIDIVVEDATGIKTQEDILVTEGKDMQTASFGGAELIFNSDGKNPVKITFKSKEDKAVWLNSFILSEWF